MKRTLLVAALVSITLQLSLPAEQLTSGKNVNVVGGPATLDARGIPTMGDPYLQRQNEPSMACSARNPLNCLAGANDYRRLNFPGVKDGRVTGDAWLGTFWTRDGGNTWRSGLLPGYAEDLSPLGQASPAHGYEAGADPVVRPGTNGLFYYAGIAFNRSAISSNAAGVEGKDGVMFVARYIDDNNTQTIETPFRYLGASAAAYSNAAKFLDKPALAVDVPRSGSSTCTISGSGDVPAQTFAGGNVYVAYAAFMGNDNVHTKIQFHRSTDCGQTWGGAAMLSESFKVNQSPSIAIEPQTGRVFVTWREFAADKSIDRIVVAVSNDLGKTFSKGVTVGLLQANTGGSASFDQPTLPSAEVTEFRLFRTNSYPTACVASNGTAYVAWAQRGLGPLGEARIVYTTSSDGVSWTMPRAVEPTRTDGTPYNGHQFMPALACAGNQATLIWYDQRGDAIADVLPAESAFAPMLLDARPLTIPTRTLDVRAAHAIAGQTFGPSVPVTRYPLGVYMAADGTPGTIQLQYSLENLPMFAGGVVPFMGDYIDLAPATTFLPVTAGDGQTGVTASGATFKNQRRGSKASVTEPNGWVFNTTAEGTPPFHAVWTDNRDVAAGHPDFPIDQENPPCNPGTQAGAKNQNVYTSRLSSGLVAGVLGNARPLGSNLRAFSVFVQNLTPNPKRVELRIANQPGGGGTASFIQFAPDPPDARFPFPLEALIGEFAPNIPAFSAIARTVFVSGSGNSAIRVDVDELVTVGGTTTVGQQLFAMINPDPTNPAPLDPALRGLFNETHESTIELKTITNYDLLNPNFLNPNFLNPTFLNPNFLNPNFLNPTFLNPTFLNPNFLNPNFLNPNFLNPTFLNPTFLNPTFLNPTFLNPTFLNTTLTELEWDVDVEGNTGSSYLLALLSSMNFPSNWQSQLLIFRVYLSPSGGGIDPLTGQYDCARGESEQHDLLTDVLNPNFLNPNFLNADFSNPNFLNSALSANANNATFSLASGDRAKVVLRVAHDGTFQPSFVTAVTIPEAVDTADATDGVTTPSVSNAPLAFNVPPVLPSTVQGTEDFSVAAAVTGGTAPYTWADLTPANVCFRCVPIITQGIPPGTQLDTTTGVISGTPTTPGSWVFRIQVTDSSAPVQTVDAFFVIVVNEQLLITTTTIPSAIPDVAYTTTLQATGGVAPRVWSLAGGTLPAGITLSADGVLSGTTTVSGTFPFTAQVQDSGFPKQTATRPFTLVVSQPSVSFVQQPSDGSAGLTLGPAVRVRVQDGAGGVLPAVPVSLAFGTNPAGAQLSGTLTATTDEAGVATFGTLNIDRDGEGFTLAATSFGSTVVSNTFNVGSISFEMIPDGTPACVNGCAITNQFASRGVVFSFTAFVDPEQNNNVTLVNSTGVDPAPTVTNHSISNPGGPGGGFTGTMHMSFPASPAAVKFRVRAPTLQQDQFVPLTVTALDANGIAIPEAQIQRTGGLYTPSAACCGQYRQEFLTITNPGGISRVSIDAGFGLIFVDNLMVGSSGTLFAVLTQNVTGDGINNAALEVVDLNTHTTVRTLLLGARNPVSLSISPDAQRAYIVDRANSEVLVINAVTGQGIATIPAPDPRDGILTADGETLFVSAGSSVLKINTATNAVQTLSLDGPLALGLALSPDGTKLAVVGSNQGSGLSAPFYLVDTAAFTATLVTITNPGEPTNCITVPNDAVFTNAGRVLLWDSNCDTVYQVDVATAAQVTADTIRLGRDNGSFFNFNNILLFSAVTQRGYVLKETPALGVLTPSPAAGTTFTAPSGSFVPAVTPNGLWVYTSILSLTGGSDTLVRFDTATNTFSGTLYTFTAPTAAMTVRDMTIVR